MIYPTIKTSVLWSWRLDLTHDFQRAEFFILKKLTLTLKICIKGKYQEIVALGIINCPLIIPYRLTKICSDSTKEPLRLQ